MAAGLATGREAELKATKMLDGWIRRSLVCVLVIGGGVIGGGTLGGCPAPVTTTTPDASAPDAAAARDASNPEDTAMPRPDTGMAADVGRPDANLPPYDGGPPAMCTGLAPVLPTEFCAARADAFVAWYERCHLVGARGAAALRASIVANCDTRDSTAAVMAGRATYDGAAVACCLAHAAADATCFGGFGVGVDECNNTVMGTVAIGGACTSGWDCADGYCHVTDACPGACTAFAADGAHCELGDATCRPGSDCDTGYNGASDVCVSLTGRASMPCNIPDGMGCEPGLVCAAPDAMGNGTCRVRPARGAACDGTSLYCDLESSICDYDITSMTGGCAPHYAEAVMHCVNDLQCDGDLYCAAADVRAGIYGTCTARAGVGESCATNKCIFGSTCLPSRICGNAPSVGEACTEASGCRGASFCATGSGICQPGRDAGAACTKNSFCASGNCEPITHRCAPDCTP